MRMSQVKPPTILRLRRLTDSPESLPVYVETQAESLVASLSRTQNSRKAVRSFVVYLFSGRELLPEAGTAATHVS